MNTHTTCVFALQTIMYLSLVCVHARCTTVSQCVFDIYSGPPVEQVSQESTTCSSAQTHTVHLLPRAMTWLKIVSMDVCLWTGN